MPRITVPRDNPLARATAVTPPKPMASASAAATKRRVRSSKTRERTSNLYAKPPASGIAASIEHFRSKCSIYFVTAPKLHGHPRQRRNAAAATGVFGPAGFPEVPLSPGYHEQPGPAQHWRRYRSVADIDAFASQGAPRRSQRHCVAEDSERDVRQEEHPRPRVSGPLARRAWSMTTRCL